MPSESSRLILYAFKLRGCEDCGERPTESGGRMSMRDFHCHHRDPSLKSAFISGPNSGVRANHRALFSELAKCIVLCRQCHENRHGRKAKRPLWTDFTGSEYEFIPVVDMEQLALVDDD
jgi:hypothetical protein